MPESAQIGIGFRFFWVLPAPQKPLHHALIRELQMLQHGQMPATFQPGRQLHPRNVPIARASLTQLDEIPVPRLERTDPSNETTTGRPIHKRPVALTAYLPTQPLELGTREAMIQRRPLHAKQRD